MTSRKYPFALLTCFLGLACSLLLASAVVAQTKSVELRPGVLIDPASGLAFLMSPEGGVDAFELASGNLRWHSDEADKPLALDGGRLIAQVAQRNVGRLDLAVFDAAGGRLLQSTTSELPRGVKAGISDRLETSFDSWAVSHDGAVDIGWSFTREVVGGMPRTDVGLGNKKLAANAQQTYSGALRLDLTGGATTPLATKSVVRSVAPRLLTPEKSFVARGGRQFLSADGRHILASERIADGRTWKQYRWNLYTRGGDWLGETESFLSYAPFVVADNLLLFTTPTYARRDGDTIDQAPLALRAVDVRSGYEVWNSAILDTEYRGPFPP